MALAEKEMFSPSIYFPSTSFLARPSWNKAAGSQITQIWDVCASSQAYSLFFMAPSRRPETAVVRRMPLPRAVGHASTIAEDDDALPGFSVAYLAIGNHGRPLRFPTMGMATTKLRAKGGGGGYRGAFLAVRAAYLQDASAPLIQGFWLNSKEDAPLYYKKWSHILESDKTKSKINYADMDELATFVNLAWVDTIDAAEFEPSTRVVRADAAADEAATQLKLDGDAIWVTHVLRKHPWRKTGWLRFERLEDLLPPDYTLLDILNLQLLDPITPPNAGSTALLPASGLVAATCGFPAVDEEAFMLGGKVYRIGAEAGGAIFGCVLTDGSLAMLLTRPAVRGGRSCVKARRLYTEASVCVPEVSPLGPCLAPRFTPPSLPSPSPSSPPLPHPASHVPCVRCARSGAWRLARWSSAPRSTSCASTSSPRRRSCCRRPRTTSAPLTSRTALRMRCCSAARRASPSSPSR